MDDETQSTSSETAIRTVCIGDTSDDEDNSPSSSTAALPCLVCGETNAAMHYGAMACVGCKGFFRRALMKADQLECQAKGNCVINKDLRTNCRSCRFRKCLDSGMQPAAVRPNRDYSARQKKKAAAPLPAEDTNCSPITTKTKDDWMKRMTVEMRTLLMNLLNIEAKIMKGDTTRDVAELYPLKVNTLKEIIENPTVLNGKRSQMRYEPYRMAQNRELSIIAYRRLIAAIDWVELLSELIGGLSIDDKIALIKNCFAPLMVFKFASRTAEVAKDFNILCLCNFAYVPRNISEAYSDSYHLGNGLVGRTLDELVSPYRNYGMREEEIVCVSAMLALNPLARDLSPDSYEKILEFRNRIQDTLFVIVKEARMSPNPAICFGHLLLSLPIVTSLANTMCENLQFAQTFSSTGAIPLLTDLFGCFAVEPFSADEETGQLKQMTISNDATVRNTYDKAIQTDETPRYKNLKRHRDVLDDEQYEDFRLLKAPGHFTLTEMFDDISRDVEREESEMRLNNQGPALLSSSCWSQPYQSNYNQPHCAWTYLPSGSNDNGCSTSQWPAAANPLQRTQSHPMPSTSTPYQMPLVQCPSLSPSFTTSSTVANPHVPHVTTPMTSSTPSSSTYCPQQYAPTVPWNGY